MAEKFLLRELCRYPIGTWADIIYRNALLHGDQEVFIYKDERITFAEYNARVNSLVHALQALGGKKGDGIGILSWNCLEYADVYGAAMKGGFVVSPVNPRLHADEIEYIVNYSEAETLFVGQELVDTVMAIRPRLSKVKNYISLEGSAPGMVALSDLLATHSSEEPEVLVNPDDPYVILYTSGTTGRPRGAVYTHRRKMASDCLQASALGMEAGDKHIMMLPLFHIGGATHFWAFFYGGGSNVIMHQRSFDPAATLRAIQDEKATDLHIVPTHLVSMLAVPDVETYDLTSLKRIWYAASPMPTELLRKGMKKFGAIFLQGYGQTESGPNITHMPRKAHEVLGKSPDEQKILASCGQPFPSVHARIVDDGNEDVKEGVVGEIVVQSESVMVEYWRKPAETSEVVVDGWLHTGDMGYYDHKGYIYIVDRKKDMIVTGGENVYPREVEEILYRHPAVQEAAVIGLPDDVWVERVHAVIVLREGEPATDADIMGFCKERLARYKAPKSVEFVTVLPKNPQGKILKRELREKYWTGRERRV